MNFLTIQDVAQRLAVSRSTVYALCASGKLEHHRVGGAIRISAHALAEFLDTCRSPRRGDKPGSDVRQTRTARLRHIQL